MKKITVTGRLTKDAGLYTTQRGDNIARFSIASDDGYGDKKHTDFFECSYFSKSAEKLVPYLTKGKPVTVSGDFSGGSYQKSTGETVTTFTIRVTDVELGAKSDNVPKGEQHQEEAPKQQLNPGWVEVQDEQLPF